MEWSLSSDLCVYLIISQSLPKLMHILLCMEIDWRDTQGVIKLFYHILSSYHVACCCRCGSCQCKNPDIRYCCAISWILSTADSVCCRYVDVLMLAEHYILVYCCCCYYSLVCLYCWSVLRLTALKELTSYGAGILPPNAEDSAGPSTHPHVNCKVKTPLMSFKLWE